MTEPWVAVCGACYTKFPEIVFPHYQYFKCDTCKAANKLARWEGCYICRRPEKESEIFSVCQDCGERYCDECFHTPCHDLCAARIEDIGGYHFTSPDCPHWKRVRS